jgi:ribonuclease Z
MQLRVSKNNLPFPLHFHTITGDGVLVENEKITIRAFKTDHRIECYGFSFEEKVGKRKLLIDKVRKAKIPQSFYTSLQQGLDYITPRGETILNDDVTTAPERGKRYAFCADTRYNEDIIQHIYGFDTIYHESTYLDNMHIQAGERYHSTTKQAATLARKAMVHQLLLGHFSSKYATLEAFQQEAKEIFPNTELAIEGVTYEIH